MGRNDMAEIQSRSGGRAATRRLRIATPVFLVSLVILAQWLAAAPARAAVSDFNFDSVGASLSTTRAGAHPDVTTEFSFNGDPAKPDSEGQPAPWGVMRNVSIELPPGLVGDPEAFPTCRAAVLASFSFSATEFCPPDSQVGVVSPGLWNCCAPGLFSEPLYNLESPGGDVVARLGFVAVFYPVFIDVKTDPARDYALTATIVNSPANADLTGADTTIWGAPTDHSHDAMRRNSLETLICTFEPCPPANQPTGLPPTAFMANSTSCEPRQIGFAAANYALPERVVTAAAPLPELSDCESVPFAPTMSLQPTTRRASASSGMDVDLSLPQENLTDPSGVRTADLKRAVVRLPEGLSLNASAADGLGGCSEAEIGLVSTNPIRFNSADPSCPESSKVGTAKITTPVLADPLEGSLYVARQRENPFHSFLSGYLVAKGKGITIKVAGRFDLDPNTGQITAVFDNNPQQPFSDLQLHFKGGARGLLVTPSACGTYRSHYELTPWSGAAPVSGESAFVVNQGCGARGFHPRLKAGSVDPVGGSYARFEAEVTRADGEQNIAGLDLRLPRGELAKLAGVPLCPAAAAATGNCPSKSRVGVARVAVGSGTLPLWVPQPGREPTAVYLAGAYKSSPYSLVVKVPAQAGPFDLGTVVTRVGIDVDPKTAQLTAKSDPLPQILEGVPIGYRAIDVDVDRPRFTLNPTSCRAMSVDARLISAQGALARPQSPFQAVACGELGFKPKLALKLSGKTSRGAFPSLRATLKMPAHGADIRHAQVALPHSEFLEQGHIGTVCTRVQFAAGRCPAASVYGHARAATPLLDKPLAGNVYLRSSNHELPDLVADLRGQIHIVLAARIDSVNGGIRTTFNAVPDAPVRKFVLTMKGGQRGLLVNSTNLCGRAAFATARFTGQNGKHRNFRPRLRDDCAG
jgi:hypothetical protein